MERLCEEGDGVGVEKMIERNPEIVNMSFGEGQKTPLHIACEKGQEAIVKILLENNANVEAKNVYQSTPLHVACWFGHEKIASLLLEKNANLEAKNESVDKWTPLHVACQNGHKEVATLLLANNAQLEAKERNEWTPLHLACRQNHIEVVSLLLANNANVEAKDEAQWTPLHVVCNKGYQEIISLLLSYNANISAKTQDDSTPLHVACWNGNKEVASLLLENNANFEAENKDGKKPIHFDFVKEEMIKKWKREMERACREGRSDVVEKIFGFDPDCVNYTFDLSKAPLHVAAQNENKRIVCFLLFNGANANVMDEEGVKPIDLKIVQDCLALENKYGHFRDIKKFSQEVDKIPNGILDRLHKIQQLSYKNHISQENEKISPPPLSKALSSFFQKAPYTTPFSLLLKNSDIVHLISICESALTQKSQFFQPIMHLLSRDEILAILCYAIEGPYFVALQLNKCLIYISHTKEEIEKKIGNGEKGEPTGMGFEGYHRLLEGALRKLPQKSVKIEGIEGEVGCVGLGFRIFDLREEEGIIFPFSGSFYEKTGAWKVIKTSNGYVPSPPLMPSAFPSPTSSLISDYNF